MEQETTNHRAKTKTGTASKTNAGQSTGKKFIFPTLIFILGFLAASPPTLCGLEKGYKFIRNYSYLEYDHAPQNYGMVQAENGVLYFANIGGVLEYDGVTWRVHYMEGRPMRSLAINDSGTVFVGGYDGQLWYLAPGPKGTLEFVSLSAHVDEKHRSTKGIWSTHAVKSRICFRTSKYLYIWDHRKMVTLEAGPESTFKSSFVHNGELIVQDAGKGLLKLTGDTLQPLPGGDDFAGPRIRVFTSFSDDPDDNRILVGRRASGFHLYDGENISPFPTEADDYLKQYKLNHGIRLSTGEFALAAQKGLVIISREGKLNAVIDAAYGLQHDNIKYVFRDKWENIWLCKDSGMSKIEYHSPFSFIENTSTLPGLVMAVVRHKNSLYVGARNGLFHAEHGLTFKPVPGAVFSCNSLISDGNRLLAATDRGVFQVENDRLVTVIEDPSLSLLNSKHFPGLIWCGTTGGLLIALENNGGRFREAFRSESIDYSIHSMAEETNGDLWLGTAGDTVVRVRFPNGLNQPEITPFGEEQGLLGGESFAAEGPGYVMIGTTKGLFKFNHENGAFIPDPVLGKDFAGGENAKPVFRTARGWDGQIWFISRSLVYRAVPESNDNHRFQIIDKPFRRLPLDQTNAVYPDPALKTVWFARNDGLYGFDTSVKKDYRRPFTPLVRRVMLNEGGENQMILYNGDRAEAPPTPQIAFKNRDVYFEYAAPFFEAEDKTLYQCLLEGYDGGWTVWSRKTKRSYTNLDPGVYRFRVRAKNVYGTVGEGEYRFRIPAPWYRTWWMYLLYTAFFIFFVYMLVRWRSRKLVREKQHLENTVTERTREIHDKNLQLERQTRQLHGQSEKLKEMDRVKSRFFSNISHEFRTPLTLILGPLEQMLSDAADKKGKKRIHTMLSNTQLLLNLINQLLDLSRLDGGKEKLRAARRDVVPFLKGVIANFETAAEQKKLDLSFHADPGNITFYFDGQKMEKVMNNLLMNAVKYTPSGGAVTVSVSISRPEHPDRAGAREFVKISVKDSGAGIPRDQVNHIFDRFFQAERLKTKPRGGAGIGLAVVKEYVDLHQGKIDVHSLENKGTEFVLRFFTGSDHLEPDQISDVHETAESPSQPYKTLETEYHMEEAGDGDAADAAPETADDAETPGKPVVLVVEDNADVRRYICEPLTADYSVIEAVDGDDGIKKALTRIPDLIVSDVMMPGTDGYELCRTLKKDIKTSHIPIILLTAKASKESVVEGLDTGADDYVTKPFNTEILSARIKNLIELRMHLQSKIQKQMLMQPDEINVSSMDREFINDLKAAIQKHMSEADFGVERLSELVYMDRSTLFRKIKALTGETPQVFIRSFRLQRGAELLKKKFGTVSQVAYEVGFDNVAYFGKCFKDKYNILPSSYIAANYEDQPSS